MNNNYPTFFVVGAPRCGTTSMYEYLKKTDGIYMSPVKEPNYFSRIIIPDDYIYAPIRDEKKYFALFSNIKNESIVGEASTTYLQDPAAPKLIHEKIPNAKIIMSLRDPVERAFSHYLHFQSTGFEKRSFDQAIKENLSGTDNSSGKDYVGAGMYFEQVKRYISIFGEKNAKIILFEDFSKNTKKLVSEIYDFLHIQSELPRDIDIIYNQYSATRTSISQFIINNTQITKISRKIFPETLRIKVRETILTKKADKPSLSTSDKEFLKKTYELDVYNLQNFLDMSFPWSNFQH